MYFSTWLFLAESRNTIMSFRPQLQNLAAPHGTVPSLIFMFLSPFSAPARDTRSAEPEARSSLPVALASRLSLSTVINQNPFMITKLENKDDQLAEFYCNYHTDIAAKTTTPKFTHLSRTNRTVFWMDAWHYEAAQTHYGKSVPSTQMRLRKTRVHNYHILPKHLVCQILV